MLVCTKTFAIEIRSLKARRHAVPDDLAEHSAVKPDFADVKLILFFRPHQVDQAENRTRKL